MLKQPAGRLRQRRSSEMPKWLGIAKRTLWRARQKHAVYSRKTPDGHWVWTLPEQDRQDGSQNKQGNLGVLDTVYAGRGRMKEDNNAKRVNIFTERSWHPRSPGADFDCRLSVAVHYR
jgi:hypothetical protein